MVTPLFARSGVVVAFFFVQLLLARTGAAQAPVQLSPWRDVSVANSGNPIQSAQILGSAHEDLVTFSESNVSIIDSDPLGSPSTTSVAVGGPVMDVTTGDLDQDGDVDIVCRTSIGELRVLLNQGGGSFSMSATSTMSTQRIHLADLTGDGFLDILCGGHRFLNDGTGAFPTSIVFTPGTASSPIDVIPGDFDGDGDQDIVSIYSGTTSAGSGIVARLFRRTAAGTYTQLVASLLDPATTAYAEVADMNGDGKDDLVLSTPFAGDYPGHGGRRFRTFLGQTGPSLFALADQIVNDGANLRPAIADWNADGFLDLAVAATSFRGTTVLSPETRVGILVNDGNGVWSPARGRGVIDLSTLPIFGFIPMLGVTDDDLDGAADLVIAQFSEIAIWRNEAALATPVTAVVTNPAAGTIVVRETTSRMRCDVTLSAPFTNPPVPLDGRFVFIDFVGPTGTPYRLTHLTSITGQLTFSLPIGYATPSVPIVISTPVGVIGNFTVIRQPTITITGGSGQSVASGAAFAPVTGQLLEANGTPIAGISVYMQILSGPSNAVTSTPSVTDSGGNFSFSVLSNVSGVSACRFIVPEEVVSNTFTLTTTPVVTSVIITQGAGQTACGGAPIVPIVGMVVTQLGTPLVGVTVSIGPAQAIMPGVPVPVTFTSLYAQTDANGVFTFTGVGNPVVGTRAYVVAVSGVSANATFNLSSQVAPFVTVASGQGQSIDLGEALPSPIEISVTDCFGAPVAGTTVNLAPQTLGVAVPSTTLITDSMGRVSFVPTFSNIGVQRIRASVGSFFVDVTTTVRGLVAVNLVFLLAISFQHDHAGVPLLLAVDTPPTSPYLSTPYGDIWTTIIAPQPTLIVLDGFGLFGSVDPGMVTNSQGSWLRTYALQPEFYNVTFIAQMYGYDNLNVFPDDYIVSNAVYFVI